MKSTRAPSSSRGVQWGLSEMPDVATQAHRGPRSQGSDHGSKSQRAGTEKRAGERLLPSRSNSTRKGTHHVVKRPDQAGRRGPARGPTHLHPTRDTTVNPTTTRSYVEVVRGVAQRSGRPATVRGPPHVTRYILLPRAPTHPPQPPSAQQRHEGEGRGFVLRSPKGGLSAGTWRRKVVMCPRRGNDPASGHPRAHQPPLGRGTSPPAWDGRLDAPGQRRRHLPSSAWTRRREVKQGKSGGSVGTTDQGKGKGRSVVRPMGTVAYRGKGQGKGKGRGEGRLGQGGRGRSKGGEKLMGTTAYGGKGSKGRAANGDRPVGAASCRRDHHTMASCQTPPPRAVRDRHRKTRGPRSPPGHGPRPSQTAAEFRTSAAHFTMSPGPKCATQAACRRVPPQSIAEAEDASDPPCSDNVAPPVPRAALCRVGDGFVPLALSRKPAPHTHSHPPPGGCSTRIEGPGPAAPPYRPSSTREV